MIELKTAKVGSIVTYEDGSGKRERGIITSSNERFVFVRFGVSCTSQACQPEDLEYG